MNAESESEATAAAGWYPDPHAPGWLRYWSGIAWTEHTAPLEAAAQQRLGFELPEQPERSEPGARALAPDLARGFMLLMIAIANVSFYLWGRDDSSLSLHPTDGTALDRALAALTIVFVDGRIYPMFAFLFGYGIVQFTISRARRGVPVPAVRRMLRRRHWYMIAFGAVHAALLFSGDILGAYGLAGLALGSLLVLGSDRTVRMVAWILAGLVALFALSGFALMLVTSALLGGLELPAELGAEGFGGDFQLTSLMLGGSNYLIGIPLRLAMWAVSSVGAVLSLVVPLCIVLGGLAARRMWLERPVGRLRLGTVAVVGISVAALAALPQALAYLGVLQLGETLEVSLMMLTSPFGVFGGLGYAALFALIGIRLRGQVPRLLSAVTAVGKRSLSFYLLQSLVFAPLLSPWGFGLGARIGTSGAFGIALGVWLLSLVLASLLERGGRRGPAEVLLRRLTYGRDVSG